MGRREGGRRKRWREEEGGWVEDNSVEGKRKGRTNRRKGRKQRIEG